MATVRLVLTKPLNVSLQAKTSNVSSTTANIDSGAWDIIYFVRMENGKQIGDIYRLGKCINIETAEGDYYSEEMIVNGDFSEVSGSGWSGQGLRDFTTNPGSVIIGDSSATYSAIKQFDILTIGKEYEIRVDVLASSQPGSSWPYISINNYDGSATHSADYHYIGNVVGSFTYKWKANVVDLELYASGSPVYGQTMEIDNVSIKDVTTTTSSQYLVDVEVDSTAQTPNSNDFIFFGKENKVCISGVKGYYAEVEMKNDSTEKAELFSVGSEMTPSSK